MQLASFYKQTILAYEGMYPQLVKWKLFNSEVLKPHNTVTHKMTLLSILYEAFYHSLHSIEDKQNALFIRFKRWRKNFGLPSIQFLISYNNEINLLEKKLIGGESRDFEPLTNPDLFKNKIIDKHNQVMVLNDFSSQLSTHNPFDNSTHFIKTYNPIGGYTLPSFDPYTFKFLSFIKNFNNKACKVLEIGAGLGYASIAALKNGAEVFCNDIEPLNLAFIENKYKASINFDEYISCSKNLNLLPGSFPEELQALPPSSFDAILISRVLHFFSGEKIHAALKLIFKLLKSQGRIYIICETPYLKNWVKFIPEYELRVQNNVEWPGEISNPSQFESSGRSASLPELVHWFTKEAMENALLKNNFKILASSYINRINQFPSDLLLDGRESLGIEAIKIEESHDN